MTDTITAPHPDAEIRDFLATVPETPPSTDTTAPLVPPSTTTETPPAKVEAISTKAAKESKALRASREKQAVLEAKVAKSAIAEQSAAKLAKIEKLFAEDPRAALIELGLEPTKAYRDLTEKMLEQGVFSKDPVEEKLKAIDPYLESLKKREKDAADADAKAKTDANVKAMVQRDIYPILAKAEEYECLHDFFATNTSGVALSADEVKHAVAQSIFDNANEYYNKELKGDVKLLQSRFGNIETYFRKVAAHLEKQVEDGLDQAIKKAAKLKKFKARFKTDEVSKETVSDQITLDDVMSVSKEKPATQKRAPDIRYADRDKEIEQFLREQGLI